MRYLARYLPSSPGPQHKGNRVVSIVVGTKVDFFHGSKTNLGVIVADLAPAKISDTFPLCRVLELDSFYDYIILIIDYCTMKEGWFLQMECVIS